jgi:RecA-family ATPase
MNAQTTIEADSVELPDNLTAELDSCRRLVAAARKDPAPALQRGAVCVFRIVTQDTPDLFRIAVDTIYNIASAAGMKDDGATQQIIDGAIYTAATTAPSYEDDPTIRAWERNDPRNKGQANGQHSDPGDISPGLPTPSPDDYGKITTAKLPATIDDTTAIVPAKLISPAAWPDEAPPPVDWLVTARIPRGDVTTLHGDGGAGKTDIALRLGANVARGAPDWLGQEIAFGKVLFVSGEEPERELQRRMWLHSQRDGYRLDELADSFRLWLPDKISDAAMAVADRHASIMRPTRILQEIAAAIVDLGPVLVIVDNVAATFAGNQNDRVSVRSFVNLWRQIAHGPSRPAVLLLDHPSLSGLTSNTGRGGNMDWRNAVRSALWLHPPTEGAEADRGIRILETAKSNYGPPGNPLRLIWADGGLQLEHTQPSHHRAAKDAECDETFLRLLDQKEGQGFHVSGQATAPTYAPKAFANMPDNGGFARKAFAAAMERLLTAGKIVQVMEGPASRQRGRLVRRPA